MRVATNKQLCQRTLSSETPQSHVCRTQSLEAITHDNISEAERHGEGKTPYEFPFLSDHLSGRKRNRSQRREVLGRRSALLRLRGKEHAQE